MKPYSKILILILVFLLINSFVSVLAEEEETELKSVDYYLGESKFEEFNSLSTEKKGEVLKNAPPEKRTVLIKRMTEDIYLKEVLSQGGNLAESLEVPTQIGIDKANYPKSLTLKGFNDENLGFYGGEGKKVIGDGKSYLNLETIPKSISEIEYVPEKKGDKDGFGKESSRFILKGKDGEEVTLFSGSINEEGELSGLSNNKGKVGNAKFSLNLNDYEFKGKVGVFSSGFDFSLKGSYVKHNGFTFGLDENREWGKVDFYGDGLWIRNTYVKKDGEFAVKPTKKDEDFRVILGDDWSEFLGDDYPKRIKLDDVGSKTKTDSYTAAPGGYLVPIAPVVTTIDDPRGELTILPVDGGGVAGFEKVINGKTNYLRLASIKDLNDLKKNAVYKSSSQTMQGVMESMVNDNTNRNMQFVRTNIFSDNRIVRGNPDLYKEFMVNANLKEAPVGVAISSPGVDGKIDIFANLRDSGAKMILYKDVGMLSVGPLSKDGLEINVDPSNGKGTDYILKDWKVTRVGLLKKAETTIDEIRFVDYTGGFDSDEVVQLGEGKSGFYSIQKPEKLTVFNGKFNPIANEIVLNNGDVSLGKLKLPVDDYIKGVESALDAVKKSEGDVKNIADFLRDANKLYSEKLSPEEREVQEANVAKQLQSLKANPNIPDSIKSKLPDSVKLIRPELIEEVVMGSEMISEAFRLGIENDIIQLRDNPFIGEVNLKVDRKDIDKFDTSTIENFGKEMQKRGYEMDIRVKTPEFESLKLLDQVGEIPLINEYYKEGVTGMKEIQRDLFENAITETLVKGVIGNSVMVPQTPIEISWWPDQTPPSEIRLKQEYVDDISRGVTKALGSIDIEGETRLRMINSPGKPFEILFESGGKLIPLDLSIETKQFVKDSISLGFNAPSNLRGYYDITGPVNVINAPVMPNQVFSRFCNSVGYRSGFCGQRTGDQVDRYLDNYYLQSK